MVLPIWAAYAVAGLAISGVSSYFIYNNWEKLKKLFNGKSIVILGQRATGKTTLLNYLLKGEITLKHEATIGVEKVKISKKKLADLGWDVRLNATASGSTLST